MLLGSEADPVLIPRDDDHPLRNHPPDRRPSAHGDRVGPGALEGVEGEVRYPQSFGLI